MIKYFLKRPVAILVLFSAAVVSGALLIFKIPVSLLPAIEVPRMVIRVNYVNASAQQVEDLVLKPIREALATVDQLKGVHSEAANHQGTVYLDFDYSTNMSLAYIEVNEQVDRLAGRLPAGVERPQVIRINTSDIPVVRVQVIPSANISYEEVSDLTDKVIKRRLEQLPGVSVVDVSGQNSSVVALKPDFQRLSAYKIGIDAILNAVGMANQDLGGLHLKNGQYQYFIKLENRIKSLQELGDLSILSGTGASILLKDLATFELVPGEATGFHLFNGVKGLVVTVQGQANSRMNELVPLIKKTIADFKIQYPAVSFDISQDQSFLLDAGTDNFNQDIFIGGFLTVAFLFLFLGNWAAAVLMSISIPISLVITFIFFYFFGLSFNIISLAGLALGIGMLIDNSIVVIGHITRMRIAGMSVTESCIFGTTEMMAPVTSQVLTTVFVYAPLILLSGLAGALVMDQCIALTISLFVSLLVAFVLTPVLYKLLLKAPPEQLKEDTALYKWVQKGYHRMISYVLLHRRAFLVITFCMMPLGFILAVFVPFESLPHIEKKEGLVKIRWNEPVAVEENLRRSKMLLEAVKGSVLLTEADIGATQFLFQQQTGSIYESQIYYACASEKEKAITDNSIKRAMTAYPASTAQIIDAPNAFTQLFVNDHPYLQVKFKPMGRAEGNFAAIVDWFKSQRRIRFDYDQSTVREPSMVAVLDLNKMNLFGISRTAIDQQLQLLFGNYLVGELMGMASKQRIFVNTDGNSIEDNLSTTVRSIKEVDYPLSAFVSFESADHLAHVSADKDGEYKALVLPEQKNIEAVMKGIRAEALRNGYSADFSGRYFENQELMKQMGVIFLIVLILLYTVLAIQFESFIQPVIVMLTIPLGITGAVLLLLCTGGSFNVMSAIGFVVVLGLIVDDPLLKIDTLNRLTKQYIEQGYVKNEALLFKLIHEAGDICLKPLLMVSLTTSIALLPILFIGGIGNDLQRPMAFVIIGGLTIGTFFTTWFIPLAYWYLQKWTKKYDKTCEPSAVASY